MTSTTIDQFDNNTVDVFDIIATSLADKGYCILPNALPLDMIKVNKGYKIEWMVHAKSFRITKIC